MGAANKSIQMYSHWQMRRPPAPEHKVSTVSSVALCLFLNKATFYISKKDQGHFQLMAHCKCPATNAHINSNHPAWRPGIELVLSCSTNRSHCTDSVKLLADSPALSRELNVYARGKNFLSLRWPESLRTSQGQATNELATCCTPCFPPPAPVSI